MAPVDRRVFSRALIAGALIGAVGLTACGRKGPLEAPSPATKLANPADPNAPADPGSNKPDKPFVLDWLL